MQLGGLRAHFSEDLLPVGNLALALTLAAPEEIIRMCDTAWRRVPEIVGDFGRQQDIDGCTGSSLYFCLSEKERVVIAKLAFFHAGGITCPKTTPAQKLQIGSDAPRICCVTVRLLSACVVTVRCFDQGFVLLTTERQSFFLIWVHIFYLLCRIVRHPSLIDGEAKKGPNPLLLVVARCWRTAPTAHPGAQCGHIQLPQA